MKMADFDPCGSQNPESILMKLDMVDYVRDPNPHDNFVEGSATWVVWEIMRLVASMRFFSCLLFRVWGPRHYSTTFRWSIPKNSPNERE